jgi:hypothetical protein
LGEFSPLGRVFTLVRIFLIDRRNVWATFPQIMLCIDFDKTKIGPHFGRFFKKSSGTDVMIKKKYFPQKFQQKYGVFDSKQS